MSWRRLLPLLPFLVALGVKADGDGSGSWTMTASSGCVILAEIDDTASPQSITAMIPICTGATSTVNWPFSSGGLGVKSNMAIYAGLTASGGGSAPGCYMSLENMQVEYLLSRDLKWDTSVNELWDNTAGGYLLDSTTYAVMGWYVALLHWSWGRG